jgi:protein SDA1
MASASGASGIAATIERLATLQNLVKRDPEAYREEFALQHQHYLAELEILKLNPAAPAESFTALVHFLAHVCACYKKETGEFPGQLMDLLSSHAELLVPEVRRGVAQALILMRNRDVVEALPLHRLFFSLFRLKDRQLRELLQTHIIHDIRNINQVKRDEGTNRAVQSLIYSMMTDASPQAAHRSLNVLVELYRRHVWQDARSVNAIAAALLSPHSKLLITALNFFLGVGSNGATDVDDEDGGDDDSDSDGEIQEASLDARTLRRALATHAHSKHTKRRARQTERMIAGLKKNVRKAAEKAGPVFPAIQLIHDPQGIAERLFGRLRTAGEK